MDILTIVIAIIGVIGAIIGIIKGLLELIDFIQKKKQAKAAKNSTITNPDLLSDNFTPRNDPENPSKLTGVLHNLPPRNEFVGRKDELQRLHKSLLERSHIICIDGIGGIGKTSLALEFAHECLEKSNNTGVEAKNNSNFKGYIWITTKDDNLLDGILDETAYTLNHIPIMKQPLEEKKKSILKLLQDIPSLIIIDGYEAMIGTDAEDFILKIPEPTKVLITTRNNKIPRSKLFSLSGLSEQDALELIKTHGNGLGLSEIQKSNDDKLKLLFNAVEGHPLAIKWVLGQIKQRGQSLNATLKYLSEAKGTIFDQIFLNSWALLTQDAQNILRIMPIFVTDASRQAIEIGSHIFGDEFDKAILQLTEMSLVQMIEGQNNSSQRYGVHPLTRAFASAQLEASDPKVSFHTKKKNLAHFFEEHTRMHGGLWNLDGFQIIKFDIFNIISITNWCIEEKFFDISANIVDNIRYFLIMAIGI